ncbi:MAG: hypothetical protein WC701_12570 [Kiritimatiellales bacterium]|jgi:hypothetical protein
MRIGKKLVVPAVCMAAFAVFGQGAANIGKSVEELKKSIILGAPVVSNIRDDKNQKFELIKVGTEQYKDMGFDGVLRLTVELTGSNDEVWYGQISKPQGKRRPDYIGKDDWEITVSHGDLKYPKVVFALEYGYQTSNAFVVVDQYLQKADSSDEIMTRNKDSKNKLALTIKTKPQHEAEVTDETATGTAAE